ncbi:MAG: hypothetical protein R2855_13595 [Thermomicrobiales bacterium]
MRDGDDETFAAFTDRFFAMLHETNPDRLIIDIRMNKGGNTTLEWPFLYTGRQPLEPTRQALCHHRAAHLVGGAEIPPPISICIRMQSSRAVAGSSPSFTGESIEFVLPWSARG